jgi:hypothetical protein
MTLYLARARGLYAGSHRWSTGYLLNSTVAESTVASTFTSAFGTLWTTATNGYANLCNADVTTVDTVVYTLNPSLRALSKTVTALSHAGTNAHDSLPFEVSVTVAMLGASDTKSDRGRMKFPTPSNDMFVGDVLTAGFQTSLKTVLDVFFTSMRGLAGYSAVKVNKKPNKQGDPAFTQHIITSYSVSNKPGSNRNRTKKILPSAFVTGTV